MGLASDPSTSSIAADDLSTNLLGSGGGSGLGSYDSLVIAAENAAEALHSHSGYSSIVAAFAASAPTEEIEHAIWASPRASGHYANGGHWSYVPVPVVVSPGGTW